MTELEVRGFRNLEAFTTSVEPGPQLLLGPNGAGKTSFLEAVYLLATTRSFRTHRLADCPHHDRDHFFIRTEVENAGRRARLEIGWAEGRRRRAVNGKETSLAEHLEVLPVVLWTADEAGVLTGPPADRRRLLDRGVVGLQPAAIAVLTRYRRALGEKRQLLARGRGELEPWNRVLAEAAADLARRRAAYVERLGAELEAVLEICDLGLGEIALRYRPSPRRALDGADAIERFFAETEKRERERAQPLSGPHRDDLQLLWNSRELRRVASAGERKALGLAVLAAHARVLAAAGRPPIYLLDDADTELDRDRLGALWRAFSGARQLFASSNRPQIWREMGFERVWRFEKGRVMPP